MITCALPAALPGDAGKPLTTISRSVVVATLVSAVCSDLSFLDHTVSGRA